jgi:predicted O-methyltransferase YrrM
MNELVFKLSRIIPSTPRRRVYKIYLNFLWTIYYKEYLRNINSNSQPGKKLIKNLVYSWGNAGWSAQQDYIETLFKYAKNSTSLIFECGSGLSTLLIGPIAKKRQLKMISFEHNADWANRVQYQINKYKLTANTILLKPLVNYGDFDWYDIKNVNVSEIGLCICDAPPGKTHGGRKGFLYLFKKSVRPGTVILVDDTIREAEQNMIEEWKNILNFDVEFKGMNDQHAILTIK